jgi:dTDP-L-rhamnose 4-epimerase
VRILVTGGAGFIGSHLVDELVRQGHTVHVVDNLEPQVHKSKPDYLNPNAFYTFRDISEEGVLPNLLREVDVVYHLAAMVGVGQSMYQITRYVSVNVDGTAKLLQFIVEGHHSIHKLVVASSMSIYGEGAYECPTDGFVSPPLRTRAQLARKEWEVRCPKCESVTRPIPTLETKPLSANSVYAVTKRDQEELCLAVGRAYGVPTVALRFFNVYGPRQSLDNPYTGVAAIFQSRIKNGQPPVLFEDGRQTRDFVSVHDIVRALLLSADKDGADYHAINVGSGTPTAIQDVANVLIDLYRSNVSPSIQNNFRAGDVRHCFADLSQATSLLGYKPMVRFEDGMKELVEWGKHVQARDHFDTAFEELRSKGLVGE